MPLPPLCFCETLRSPNAPFNLSLIQQHLVPQMPATHLGTDAPNLHALTSLLVFSYLNLAQLSFNLAHLTLSSDLFKTGMIVAL